MHKPLGGSWWTLYILRLVWNFSCRKVELIDLADLISISGEFFWITNHNCCRKDFSENRVFNCVSYPIHWSFFMIGFVVVPFQGYLGSDQSEQFKHEFGPKLGGAVLVFECLFMQWNGFFTFLRLSIINQESVWQVAWAAQIWLKFTGIYCEK